MAYRDTASMLRDYAGTDLYGTKLLSVTKRITTAQVLTMFTTPVSLVTPTGIAPNTADGAGLGIVVSHAVFHKPAGVAYAGANPVTIRYAATAAPVLITVASATLLNSTSATTIVGHQNVNDYAIPANTGVEAFISTANPTLGTSALLIQLYYYLTPVTLNSRF